MYKNALRRSREMAQDQSQQFGVRWSYKEFESIPVDPKTIEVKTKQISEVTEKARVLDQLHRFGEKALETADSVQLDGGELVKKVGLSLSDGDSVVTEIEFGKLTPKQIESTYKEQSIAAIDIGCKIKKIDSLDKIKVFFVTDSNYLHEERDEEGLSDLNTYFDLDVSNLFGRMISAMKLGQNDYAISSIALNDTDINDTVFSEIYSLRPSLVMTLGAKATDSFLKRSERLKDIHGKFFDLKLLAKDEKPLDLKLMPLFSPKLLQTAPNMKKTAWSDMQAAMKFLES